MGEDSRAVAFDMLVEPDTGTGLCHDRSERESAPRMRVAKPFRFAVLLARIRAQLGSWATKDGSG